MSERFGYVVYWLVFLIGITSFLFSFIMEYGIIYTIFITFISAGFNITVALALQRKKLIYMSLLLLLSPYIWFFILYVT
ncbi:hypothetical protein ATL39_0159 [Sinobaca qinghaiensis]|uniref:Uncharacterized protein n=1 Tax=Sinobaca qinghaiensis TaxID=342944 RepID=A0A419V7P0_9BACL|nr:hypothetical protein [Sinobaca qinghaiensis]RKD75949.1 hypothetical protein ATL39_0159 [Sinobaca qinghaiensis]